MTDTPLQDAIDKIPTNELLIEGGRTEAEGARAEGSISRNLNRENGTLSFGADASVSQNKGWGIVGFIKRIWK